MQWRDFSTFPKIGENTRRNVFCIFCEKPKYFKGARNREPLGQCRDMRADSSIRKIATQKNDSKILAPVSRELVAAEARYHRT